MGGIFDQIPDEHAPSVFDQIPDEHGVVAGNDPPPTPSSSVLNSIGKTIDKYAKNPDTQNPKITFGLNAIKQLKDALGNMSQGDLSKAYGSLFEQNSPQVQAGTNALSIPVRMTKDTAFMDMLGVATGRARVPQEDFVKAATGQPVPSMGEQLSKNYGVSKPIAMLADGYAGGVLDPVNTLLNVGSTAKPDNAKELLKNFLTQKVENEGIARPVGNMIQGLAKNIYTGPFRAVDKALQKYKGGRKDYRDFIFNENEDTGLAEPRIAPGTNEELAQAPTELRKQMGEQFGRSMGGAKASIHLGPDLEANAKSAMQDAMGDAEDLPAPLDWLKGQLASTNKSKRDAAVEILKTSMPELAPAIERNRKYLNQSGDRPGVVNVLHDLIDDVSQGPRDLEGLQDLKVANSNKAFRQNLKTTQPNPGLQFDGRIAQDLGNQIEKIITDQAENKTAFPQAKSNYSIARRGEVPATQMIGKEVGRPNFSKLDFLMALGALGATGHGPWPAITAGGTKIASELSRNPRWAITAGTALNKASQSNLWDNMLRREYLSSIANNNGANQ